MLSRIGVIAASLVLLGSGTATAAADLTTRTDPSAPPSATPAAGPEKNTRAGSRPVSGKTPKAGPTFTQTDGTWQVNRTEAVLRNTVSDADGDKANLTFEVWTTNADGSPKAKVEIKDRPYGVLVSDYVASGKTAEVEIPHGNLKPGVTYTFHTSAYDGSLYETDWSPWAKFKIRDRAVDIKVPEPDKGAPTLNQDDHQQPQKIAQPTMAAVDPTQPPMGRSAADGWNCGELNEETGIQPCSRLVPDDSKKTRDALTKGTGSAKAALPHLVDWCPNLMDSHIKRYEACIGSFLFEYEGIVVKDGKPTGEVLNSSWALGQEVKLSRNTASFDQQLILVPVAVDAKFLSVTLNVEFDCLLADRCTTGQQGWDGALVWSGADPFTHSAVGTSSHTWTGTSADTLDLSTKITAYSPVANPAATRWHATDAEIRCDKIATTKPGCAFHKYIPTWVMNFDKTPVAVAHAWLIQSKLPTHPGSKAHNKPMFFLPVAAKNGPGHDPQKNRDVICPDSTNGSWASQHGHPDTTTVPEISASDKPSCDEFAYASTYNSGGMPANLGGLNPVSSGDACVQTYATRVKQGEWHLYDDERLAGPTWNEVCGRSAMSGWINSTSMGGAFSSGFSAKYRLLDQDPYWVSFPQFGHCDASKTPVTCTVPKP
ncbi:MULTISPECIES: hypothetical protein [Streptomyces]|uniref:Uncharacterized protein n=1 Tax=Streptomyces fungicidicus TaxID=68203 RepID=A0ACC7Y7V1_9ACTN|nr:MULTISPECIES: hypothetical protein [Streptomyces]MBF4135782.1 hypothetical protein [Streptomyces albidoflavus]NUV78103.1 hypothetical protein [Streptomyces fungicidicus]